MSGTTSGMQQEHSRVRGELMKGLGGMFVTDVLFWSREPLETTKEFISQVVSSRAWS